jgi:hypothetical protein
MSTQHPDQGKFHFTGRAVGVFDALKEAPCMCLRQRMGQCIMLPCISCVEEVSIADRRAGKVLEDDLLIRVGSRQNVIENHHSVLSP